MAERGMNHWVYNELMVFGYRESEITVPAVSTLLESLLKQTVYIQTSPIMLSASQSGYVVSASSEQGTAYAYKAFSGNTTAFWEAATAANQWIKMAFPSSVILNRIKMSAASINPTSMPDHFKIQGSNDNVDWVDIYEWAESGVWIANEVFSFDFENSTAYPFYRVFVFNNQGGARIMIGELSLQQLPTNATYGTIEINASETQVVTSIANGFSDKGQVDYTIALPLQNESCPILKSAYNFIYLRRDATSGQITYEAKQFAPIYGRYQPEYIPDIPVLLRGDNTDSIDQVIDAYGNKSITKTGTISVSTLQKKFGAGSLLFSSNGSVIKIPRNMGMTTARWSIDFWWQPTVLSGNLDLISTTPNMSMILSWGRTANKLSLYLSSNGSTWDIASNVAGVKTNFVVGNWYYINLTFLGRRYMCFVDGVQDIEVATSTQLNIKQITSLNIGAYGGESSTAPGFIDDFRFRPNMGYYYNEMTPILPTEAATFQKPWYFNITEMKGYEIEEGGTFTSVQMLCLGEVFTREATSYINTPTTYAYDGRRSFQWTEFNPATDDWITLPHNMGTEFIIPAINVNSKVAASPYNGQSLIPLDALGMNSGANSWGGIPMGRVVDRLNYKIRYPAVSSSDYVAAYGGSGALASIATDAISMSGTFVRSF